MKNQPNALVLLLTSLVPAAVCVAQQHAGAREAPVAEARPSAAPDLADLRAAWPVGARLVDEGRQDLQTRFWNVDAFAGNRLTLSRRSIHDTGREVLRLQIGAEQQLEVVDAEFVGTPQPVALRRVTGTGSIAEGKLDVRVQAERSTIGEGWKPWNVTARLRPMRESDLLQKGTSVRGTRTERGVGPLATMRGRIIRCDAKWLVIEADEAWKTPKGRQANVTYQWRFQRDGQDEETGSPKWSVRDGVCMKGEGPKHRSNWRGFVVLDQGRLVGRYGFDWNGMEERGNARGTAELTHPLVLELLPEGLEAAR